METHLIAGHADSQLPLRHLPVRLILEEVLAVIAAACGMIHRAWILNSNRVGYKPNVDGFVTASQANYNY